MCIRDRISPIEVHEIKHVLTEEGRRIAVYYSHKEDQEQYNTFSNTVSYTHLDVYKRQELDIAIGLSARSKVWSNKKLKWSELVSRLGEENKTCLLYTSRASANSFGQVGVGGGIYYRNFGVDISYMRDFELTRSGYEVGFSWKF